MKRRQTYETLSLAVLVLVTLVASSVCFAQRVPHRVVFTDKGPTRFEPASPLYEETLKQFHPNALVRRARAGMDPLLDSLDMPIYDSYLEQVRSISDSILSSNPWFNCVVVGLTDSEREKMRALPGVRSVVPTNSVSYTLGRPEECTPMPESNYQAVFLGVGTVQVLHDAGVFGQGARIGMIDNGFRWKAMSSLSHLNVESEYDFIFRRPITANQGNDVPSQDEHGSIIMSVAAAWHRDSVMGVAPFGTYLLAKSEDMRYERRIEEDLYAEAIWWLERQGADISSSSLGYRTFDSTDASTPYELLDGFTTYAARAINFAVRRGMICLTAAGNSGPSSRSIITPADADSVLAIGAISLDGVTPWVNTSWGPTPTGRQKPEFAAPGHRVPVQQLNGAVGRASGTSLATPYVASQVALLRQLYPAVPSGDIRRAMIHSSTYGEQVDSILGHGALNVAKAARLLGPAIPEPAVVIVGRQMVVLAPIFAPDTLQPVLFQRPRADAAEIAVPGVHVIGDWYAFTLSDGAFEGAFTEARIVATSAVTARTAVYPAQSQSFRIERENISIPCGMRLPSVITSVGQPTIKTVEIRIAGVPLAAGERLVDVIGFEQPPVSVRLLQMVNGVSAPCEIVRHDQGRLCVTTATGLTAGAWVLECRMQDRVVHCPFIVL